MSLEIKKWDKFWYYCFKLVFVYVIIMKYFDKKVIENRLGYENN